MEMKIYIYMAHIYLVWIERNGVMLSRGPLLPQNESKTDGVMMGRDKNRLKLSQQYRGSDGLKIDKILCFDDPEPRYCGSFNAKILTRQKWLLTMR